VESLRTLRDLGALCDKLLTAESADDLLGKLARSWATTVFPRNFQLVSSTLPALILRSASPPL